MKFSLRFPSLTSVAMFLFDAINNPPILLKFAESFHAFAISPVIVVEILTLTLFAPYPQLIIAGAILTKLTLIFPFFAFGALFHLSRSHLAPHGQPLA
jgi:hypothetical protein